MFREIVNFICDKTGFVRGTDIFPGDWPQGKPVRCMVVLENGGPVFPKMKDWINATIQVMSRAEDYWEAREDIYTVYNAIHGTFGWNMPNWTGSGADYLATSVYALASPQKVVRDENGRFIFSCNFIFQMTEASCE